MERVFIRKQGKAVNSGLNCRVPSRRSLPYLTAAVCHSVPNHFSRVPHCLCRKSDLRSGDEGFVAHSDGLVQLSWFPAVVGVVCCLAVVISWWLLPGGGEVLAVGVLVSVLIALVVSPVPQPGLRAELLPEPPVCPENLRP